MNLLKKKPKHLLIDLDGTLLGNRSIPVTLDFVRLTAAELKSHLGLRQAIQAIFAVHQELKNPSSQECNQRRAIDCLAKRTRWSIKKTEDYFGGSIQRAFQKLEKHFFEIPQAQRFIEWAKTRFQLTLATNPVWPRELVELRLKWGNLDSRDFRLMTTIELMHFSKPDRRYYEEVLALLGSEPHECLMLGNDRKMDLPAVQCGIPVYLMENTKRPGAQPLKTKSATPAWSGSFAELQKLLESSSPS